MAEDEAGEGTGSGRRRRSGPPAVKVTILLPADLVESLRAEALRRGYVVRSGPQAGGPNLSMLLRELLSLFDWDE